MPAGLGHAGILDDEGLVLAWVREMVEVMGAAVAAMEAGQPGAAGAVLADAGLDGDECYALTRLAADRSP
ncbi:MAG: hypothetical protein ACRD0J_15765 [Acidimicrobiales bacterium]